MSRRAALDGRTLAPVLVGLLCLSAGCSGFLEGSERPTYDVPGSVTTGADRTTSVGFESTRGIDGRPIEGNESLSTAGETRYFDLRPNCERPASLVVAIQVGALRNDGPRERGLWTAYAFTAPGYRWALGPFPRFVELFRTSYAPLLDARTVELGTIDRTNGTATVPVTVTTDAGATATYQWRLERQTGNEYDGCWMTDEIRNSTRSTRLGASDR